MGDALCGPSNALQKFQKHTSVDRTLQQDRLVARQSPAQGFRSSPGPNAGALDAEFEAFRTGHVGPPQQFHPTPYQFAHPPPPPQIAQTPSAPDWASDFQRLNIASPPPLAQQYRAPAPSSASWHTEFMNTQAQAPPTQQQSHFGGMPAYGMNGFTGSAFAQRSTFGTMNNQPMSSVAQGKQRQETAPQFDEAAFEQAFANAHQDMLDETVAEQARTEPGPDVDAQGLVQARKQQDEMAEADTPELQRIREQRPAVYAALKIRSAIDLNKMADVVPYLSSIPAVQDHSEGKLVLDVLQKVMTREMSQEIQGQVEATILQVNQRLMSSYPLSSKPMPINQSTLWEELEAAGFTRSPAPEQVERPEQRQEQQPAVNEDSEMARTAGQLLERVADNTSEKFQNSQFLELMRRLRDREVRVEGDKVVEVSAPAQPSTSTPSPPSHQTQPQAPLASSSAIPGVDPHILDHAAIDLNLPVFSGEDQEYAALSRQSSYEPVTDEISDQFSYYNVRAAYHR